MLTWVPPFDPNETKDYGRDWTEQMNADTDTLVNVAFNIITADSGLSVVSSLIDVTEKIAKVWFTASNSTLLTAFNGLYILIDHTATTAAGRIYNETIRLKIKEK